MLEIYGAELHRIRKLVRRTNDANVQLQAHPNLRLGYLLLRSNAFSNELELYFRQLKYAQFIQSCLFIVVAPRRCRIVEAL